MNCTWSRFQDMKCNHDVNIVLFSRVFYEAKSRDQFPAHMTECVQVDYKGRFYEDFYRCACSLYCVCALCVWLYSSWLIVLLVLKLLGLLVDCIFPSVSINVTLTFFIFSSTAA